MSLYVRHPIGTPTAIARSRARTRIFLLALAITLTIAATARLARGELPTDPRLEPAPSSGVVLDVSCTIDLDRIVYLCVTREMAKASPAPPPKNSPRPWRATLTWGTHRAL